MMYIEIGYRPRNRCGQVVRPELCAGQRKSFAQAAQTVSARASLTSVLELCSGPWKANSSHASDWSSCGRVSQAMTRRSGRSQKKVYLSLRGMHSFHHRLGERFYPRTDTVRRTPQTQLCQTVILVATCHETSISLHCVGKGETRYLHMG